MTIYKTSRDKYGDYRGKCEISLFELISEENIDTRDGQFEQIQAKIVNITAILCSLVELSENKDEIIKEYIDKCYLSNITYEKDK